MKRSWLAIFLLLTLNACMLRRTPAPAPIPYFTHAVRFEGETLGLISSWYTGKSANWQTILAHNPGLDVHFIRVGDQIRIPVSMLTRKERLPNKLVSTIQASQVSEVAIEAEPEQGLNEIPSIPETQTLENPQFLAAPEIQPVALSIEAVPATALESVPVEFKKEEPQQASNILNESNPEPEKSSSRAKIPSREELWQALGTQR